MEKIIFFGLAVPILGFVFYLGGSAIMKGFKAKVEFAPKKIQDEESDQSQSELETNTTNKIIILVQSLLKDGVLTQEEFDKAKKKILDN